METLYVSWEEFSKLRQLSFECEYCNAYNEMKFNEGKWIKGLTDLFGKAIVDSLMYQNTKIVAIDKVLVEDEV